MKKEEAKILSIDRSRVVMEYITQILSDPENKGEGKLEFIPEHVEGRNELMCVIAISVPNTGFKTRINSGITAQQDDYFKEQVLNDLIDQLLDSDTMGVGPFYSIRGMMGPRFDGVTAFSANGSSLKINFGNRSQYLDGVVDRYNQRIQQYKESAQAKIYQGESTTP